MRTPAWSIRSAGVMLVLATGALLAAGGVAQASNAVPFKDSNAVGVIGFCNKAGQPITHGSIDTVPFAWRAVSSQPALAPYNGQGRSATLFAYQPRQGLAPGQWSGEELTAAARYTNPAHPMAAATDRDIPLKYFVGDYPPMWDGLVQVRMYLGAYDSPLNSVTYPATVLKVTGTTWRVVSGGSVACNSGTAVSIASLLPTATPTAQRSGGAKPGRSARATAPPSSATSPAGSGAGVGPSQPSAALQSSAIAAVSQESNGHTPAIVGLVIGGLAVIAIAAYAATRRHRSPLSSGPPSGSAHNSSEKGR